MREGAADSPTARLLLAARRWAAESEQHGTHGDRQRRRLAEAPRRDLLILTAADGERESDDFAPLLDELRREGLSVSRCSWLDDAACRLAAAAGCVLPLGVWDYSETRSLHARFVALLHAMRAQGAEPSADLAATAWCSHKSYLLQLAAAGLPAVPTVLLRGGAGGVETCGAESQMGRAGVAAEEYAGPSRVAVEGPLEGAPAGDAEAQIDAAVAWLCRMERRAGGGHPLHSTGPACPSPAVSQPDPSLGACAVSAKAGTVPPPAGLGAELQACRARSSGRCEAGAERRFEGEHARGEGGCGWCEPALECVMKPAVGGGGDGVERVWLRCKSQCPGCQCDRRFPAAPERTRHAEPAPPGNATRGCLSRLLPDRDMLLQPFLHRVAVEGELCVLFIGGRLAHVVHKQPRGWGRRRPGGGCRREANDGCKELPGDGTSQPVRAVPHPPPAVLATAERVLAFVSRRAGAAESRGGSLFLCRVDFLPANTEGGAAGEEAEGSGTAGRAAGEAAEGGSSAGGAAATQAAERVDPGLGRDAGARGGDMGGSWGDGFGGLGGVEWLVSEVEAGWPECFFRASPGLETTAARELIQHMRPAERERELS